LVLELRPYVADGKHWVLFSDGHCERRAIDRDLVKQYGLTITSVLPAVAMAAAPVPERYRYTIVALRHSELKEPVRLTLRDPVTEQEITASWDGQNGMAGGEDLMEQWAKAHLRSWSPMLMQPDSSVLQVWASRHHELYGLETMAEQDRRTGNWRRERTTNIFSVLGGRAALQETLQLQAIGPRAGVAKEQESVPIDMLAGVQVKSHPFAELLQGKPGGSLPLADDVPPDHFFVYFAKPAALISFLEGGSDFLAQTGALMTRARVDDDLEAKYLMRLGLDRQWARTFLRNGAVTELGLILPDLFLLDGTEMTVIMRVPQLALAQPLLHFLGIPDLGTDEPVPVHFKSGDTAYWARRGELLFVSTHRQELDQVLQLHQAGGQGSLGQSAEFRYMLTRLPVQHSTLGYAYLSDPFIRKLVSPGTKIAQLRRLQAHADLLTITAGALLYQADSQPGQPTLAKLVELGYVPAALAPDYSLRNDGVAESKRYSTLARPASLLINPVTQATAAEAAAYHHYLDQYNQFWRQFFDPIAMRLDEPSAGRFELATFILPLVESQLYNQVRTGVATLEKGKPLQMPSLTRQPVLMLSLNLSQEGWIGVAKDLAGLFGQYSGLDPVLLDYLGPSVHLAIADSDPIIALGSGDVMGAFGADLMQMRDMFLTPIWLSVFTQPSTLIVELTDPQQVLRLLKRAASRTAEPRGQGAFVMSLQRIEGREAWVYNLGILNVIQLSLGLEVQGDYLIITNLPWSQRSQVAGITTAPLNGALLQANPGVAERQLPALYASALAQERAATMQGISYLYPLLVSVCKTPAEAVAAHAQLFGFKPLHPASGEWLWQDGVLASSVFGTPRAQKQPEYQPGKRDFGMLPTEIDQISVNMQFEDAGLRTSVRWSWQAK
jgi:hypothetical protein